MLTRRSFVIVLNFICATVLYATATISLPYVIAFGIALILVLLPIAAMMLAHSPGQRDPGLIVGLVGTALLWSPFFLNVYRYTGPDANLIYKATNIIVSAGVIIVGISIFLPTRASGPGQN